MDRVTDQELSDIEARCGRASPGPWTSIVEGRDQQGGSSFILTGPPGREGADMELVGATDDEQDFIAHARQDIPRLLAEVARQRQSFPITSRKMETRMDRVTDQQLEEIEARSRRVPPAPWRWIEGEDRLSGRNFIDLGPASAGGGEVEVLGATPADLDFLAHARQDLTRLLAEIRRVRAEHE